MAAASSRWPMLTVVFGALTAAALLASVVLSWTGVYGAANTVARGDAQHALARVQSRLDDLGHPPTPAELDTIRAELRGDGVVYIALSEHGHEVISGLATAGFDRDPHPGDVDRVGETWRAVAMRGPPPRPIGIEGPPPLDEELPPFGEGPPPFGPPPDGPRHGGPHGPPPHLIVELVPRTAVALEQRATITLGVGALAALLVLATSLALRRAITDRESALRTSERTRHLTTLGEMSAVLAHEIRNPLASLKGHAQLLEESLDAGSKPRAKAERVVKEAVRIERLTTDLLAFVRSGTMAPRRADPKAVVRDAVESAGDARTRLTLREVPSEAPLDEDRVRGALENLIRNAREAAPEGEIEVTLGREEDELVITVRDRGPGIPRGMTEKIFEPFHTTRVHGTGLGLAVARRVAEAHDGSLVASSAPEGGAVFTMRLPLGRPAARS
ncbi:MAG: ATP-binding protein [Sandaracinus sp.]